MHRLPRAFALRNSYSYIPRRKPVFHTPRIQQRSKSHVTYSHDGEPMRVQNVRIRKPPMSMRRLVTIGLYIGALYGYLALIWRQFDVEIEFVEDEEAGQIQEGAETQEMEEQMDIPLYADEESTFVPLTWGKKMPRTFYRGSDPEWQEFIKFSKDEKRRKKIQEELAQIIQTGTAQHPSISRYLGPPAKVGHYWLDISFPDGPPQHYERQGIEIGDGYVAWSTQKVDADKQWRTERALMPFAAAEGVWSTTKVLAGIQWRRVKQQLGLSEADPSSIEEKVRGMLELKAEKDQLEKGASAGPAGSPPAAAVPSAADAKNPFWPLPNVPLPSAESASASIDLPIAMHVFSSTISKSWNPKKVEPPRGAIVVQGMVEMKGSKGRALLDVQGCYDPRASKYTHINAGLRTFKRWKQGPKGGP